MVRTEISGDADEKLDSRHVTAADFRMTCVQQVCHLITFRPDRQLGRTMCSNCSKRAGECLYKRE